MRGLQRWLQCHAAATWPTTGAASVSKAAERHRVVRSPAASQAGMGGRAGWEWQYRGTNEMGWVVRVEMGWQACSGGWGRLWQVVVEQGCHSGHKSLHTGY